MGMQFPAEDVVAGSLASPLSVPSRSPQRLPQLSPSRIQELFCHLECPQIGQQLRYLSTEVRARLSHHIFGVPVDVLCWFLLLDCVP